MTRNSTESVAVTVEADTAEEANEKAMEIALKRDGSLYYEPDEGHGTPYLGDPDGTVKLPYVPPA